MRPFFSCLANAKKLLKSAQISLSLSSMRSLALSLMSAPSLILSLSLCGLANSAGLAQPKVSDIG